MFLRFRFLWLWHGKREKHCRRPQIRIPSRAGQSDTHRSIRELWSLPQLVREAQLLPRLHQSNGLGENHGSRHSSNCDHAAIRDNERIVQDNRAEESVFSGASDVQRFGETRKYRRNRKRQRKKIFDSPLAL